MALVFLEPGRSANIYSMLPHSLGTLLVIIYYYNQMCFRY